MGDDERDWKVKGICVHSYDERDWNVEGFFWEATTSRPPGPAPTPAPQTGIARRTAPGLPEPAPNTAGTDTHPQNAQRITHTHTYIHSFAHQ